MKFDTIKELERLAAILDTKAAAADLQSAVHYQAREVADAEQEKRRAASGRHFAEVCRNAAGKLKVRVKRDCFIPPSLEEVIDFARVKYPAWDRDDIAKWWNYFESVGWVVGNSGKSMRDWHRGVYTGYTSWLEKHPAQARAAKAAPGDKPGDPAGWSKFLAGVPRRYEAFKYAAEFLKTEFRKRQQ